MLSGRDVELVAVGSSGSTMLRPILLMIAGVSVLALIGHFAFRRDSQLRPRAEFDSAEIFELFERFEGLDPPGGIDSDSATAHQGAAVQP